MDANLLIIAIIIAVTQVVKMLAPKISGVLTVILAVVVGIVVAALAPVLGVEQTSIASGILDALAAVGVHTTASAVNTKAV